MQQQKRETIALALVGMALATAFLITGWMSSGQKQAKYTIRGHEVPNPAGVITTDEYQQHDGCVTAMHQTVCGDYSIIEN